MTNNDQVLSFRDFNTRQRFQFHHIFVSSVAKFNYEETCCIVWLLISDWKWGRFETTYFKWLKLLKLVPVQLYQNQHSI